MLEGRVFLTGGAGFLARGIYRRARRESWPCTFTAYSRDDAKHVALRQRYPEVTCIRGDILSDIDYLAGCMAGHDIVIHAGAVKYVDLSETNVFDTVHVNITGSEHVIWAAARGGVRRVVGISTDKAAMPVNVYGMTKAVMERMFVDAHRMGLGTEYVVCRYGNVIGSTGSVIPKFRAQFEATGEVLLTDRNMTRYWMSVDEAVDVVVAAVNEAQSGSTVIPAPQAMLMEDVVRTVAPGALARVIGLRPGEKMHELLIHAQESVRVRKRLIGSCETMMELRPPGDVQQADPFELSSETAERMSLAVMADLIEDADSV